MSTSKAKFDIQHLKQHYDTTMWLYRCTNIKMYCWLMYSFLQQKKQIPIWMNLGSFRFQKMCKTLLCFTQSCWFLLTLNSSVKPELSLSEQFQTNIKKHSDMVNKTVINFVA